MNLGLSDSIINKVYKEKLDIASIAKIVIEAAEEGDAIAEKILDEEAEELILHIKSILNKIHSSNLNIAFSGSLIDNENFYTDLLNKKIKSTLPNVQVVKPASSPVKGAILFAIRIVDEK